MEGVNAHKEPPVLLMVFLGRSSRIKRSQVKGARLFGPAIRAKWGILRPSVARTDKRHIHFIIGMVLIEGPLYFLLATLLLKRLLDAKRLLIRANLRKK
jgi:hypothetical protein